MGKLRSALALGTIVVACGGPKTAPKAPEPPSTTKSFAPLAHKTDAKAPNQAVILGTDEQNGSTVIKLPTAETSGTVDAMFVRFGGGTASGGSTPVKLSTAPNSDKAVRVGIFEELTGGTGPQWRAGVWVSAIIAASTLGKDLTDFTFSATSGGYIDGASASGLMAGGFLATLTGEPIDPTATMTGIINPDGTIGPVGGIPEKFKGSIEKGKKRLGYPIGMRWTRSAATGQMVDLVKLAKDAGAEAVEIGSVYDAYRLLTGKALPEPLPVPAADMAVDADTHKAIGAKYKDWQKRLAEEWSTLVQLQQAGRLPTTLTTLAALAQQRAERAEKLFQQGFIGAAYSKILEAWVYAASATDTYDVLTKLQAGDGPGALRTITNLDQLEQGTLDLFKQIGQLRPSTMGGHLQMMSAYQSALRAYAFKIYASESVAKTKSVVMALGNLDGAQLQSPEIADKIVEAVAPAVLLIGLTVAETQMASQRLEFESEKTINYMCNIPNVKRMTTSFQSAGAAGVNYFEMLLVAPMAEQAGIPLDQARTRIATREPGYLAAYVLSRMDLQTSGPLADLKKELGDKSLQWNLMALAGSELAYAKSAELVTKYYSLGVKSDPATGRITAVEHEKAFLNMLVTAERTARANARAARIATGAIPVQAKLAYQLATVQQGGDMQDKIEALASYWTASAFSQAAVMLARN